MQNVTGWRNASSYRVNVGPCGRPDSAPCHGPRRPIDAEHDLVRRTARAAKGDVGRIERKGNDPGSYAAPGLLTECRCEARAV